METNLSDVKPSPAVITPIKPKSNVLAQGELSHYEAQDVSRKNSVALSKFVINDLVTVMSFGEGIVRFVGPHQKDGRMRVGVELNGPRGLNNGTVGGFYYFSCPDKYGILVDPLQVTKCVALPQPSGYLTIVASEKTDDE